MQKPGDFFVGPVKTYHENGSPNELYFCIDGNKVGVYMEFYSNGQKKTLGQYLQPLKTPDYFVEVDTVYRGDYHDVQMIVSHNVFNDVKSGNWYFWDINGNLTKTEIWDKGVLKKVE